jgi:hypothetical protein
LNTILSSHKLEHFFDEKAAKVLHYFSLDSGILKFFKHSTHEPSSKEQLLTLPLFCSLFGGKDWGLCPYHTTHLPKQ